MFKLGILREGRVPPDARAPLSPQQCALILNAFPNIQIVVQPAANRCFSDAEFEAEGLVLQEDLHDCDILLGVKEVPVEQLIPEKTYLFFSHTIKKQPNNRELLQAILKEHIRLIDYEVLTDTANNRLVAFGYYAGIVGAHNGLWTYGRRTGLFSLPRMWESRDYAAVKAAYHHLKLPALRIVLTGGGRVAAGAVQNLHDMGIRPVSPTEFLKTDFDYPVYTQLIAQDYVEHLEGVLPFNKYHFYEYGQHYKSKFAPYYRRADIFINGIFYDPLAPPFFTLSEMANPDFNIQVIADITCDLAPEASVPCTIRASSIADPVYGFNPLTAAEQPPYEPDGVDVMAVDNLPSELPRDSSDFFGKQLIERVLPYLLGEADSQQVIQRATIAENGELTPLFSYLTDYVEEVKIDN